MTLSQLISLCFAAILGENLVFVRFLGADPHAFGKKSGVLAVAMIPVMPLACGMAWMVYHHVLVPIKLQYLQLLAFVAVAALVAKAAEAVYGAVTKKSADLMPLVTVNCALLGVMLINVQGGADLKHCVVYGFFAALGFALAVAVFGGVRKRLELASPTDAFKGAPLTLIAAGLVAMAFMGFADVSLETLAALPFKLV